MLEPRFEATLVLFQGGVCGVGGYHSSTVECFNMTANTWANLPKMKAPRSNAAAVELNGELYVIDGIRDNLFRAKTPSTILNSVEKYN